MSGLVTTIPDWWAAQHGEQAAPLLQAALAEAGYPRTLTSRRPENPGAYDVPTVVFNRARRLVYMRFGIAHEWCPTCPDDWFSSIGQHAPECAAADTEPGQGT